MIPTSRTCFQEDLIEMGQGKFVDYQAPLRDPRKLASVVSSNSYTKDGVNPGIFCLAVTTSLCPRIIMEQPGQESTNKGLSPTLPVRIRPEELPSTVNYNKCDALLAVLGSVGVVLSMRHLGGSRLKLEDCQFNSAWATVNPGPACTTQHSPM